METEILELDDLFSKMAPKKKEVKEEKKEEKQSKSKPKTLLDGKRNQNLGIFIKSTNLDQAAIEDAVYNCESNIPDEVLEKIKEMQATPEELELIKAHKESGDEAPLDKPDRFLLDISSISCLNDRLNCLTFQAKFADSMSDIEARISNVKSVTEFLISSQHVKEMFGVILVCGNYLNGGNKQRGQADGFNIDILPKLKDLKSKDNSTNLLAYIIKICIVRYDEKKGTPEAALPLPEPSDVEKCIHMDFDSQRAEADKIKKDLDDVGKRMDRILQKTPDELKEPFKTKMEEFITKAESEHKELMELLEECINKFRECMMFYKWTPKKGKLEDAKPEDFFSPWHLFCEDYKTLWKKEQIRIQKEMIKEERLKHQKTKDDMKNVSKKSTSSGGLKDKIMRRKTRSKLSVAEAATPAAASATASTSPVPSTGDAKQTQKKDLEQSPAAVFD